ncbi:hypothetical protein ETTORE_0321 [Pseudomonas phage Ettore]|nr:hypothetical protein ETTORE_0321 [Pseudomonas phage Ettore]
MLKLVCIFFCISVRNTSKNYTLFLPELHPFITYLLSDKIYNTFRIVLCNIRHILV